MNRVGHEGRGESVWLGFFIYTVLNDFAPICLERGESALAQSLSRHRVAAVVAPRTGLGRRMVPARLLRRWAAAGIGAER